MKINEAEQLLGITKANIRFYEKEGLLTPSRTESGYRDYTDDDITRLKQIIILRKLGIPVQQITDILDGVMPLQEAVDSSIHTLNTEIEKLNGSLALCHQLKAEGIHMLDTERYWDIVQCKEQQGMKFHTLAQDYLDYVDQHFHNTYPTASNNYTVKKAVSRLLLFCIVISLISAVVHLDRENFWSIFTERLAFWSFLKFVLPLILGLLMIPAFIIGRKNKKYSKLAEYVIKILLALLILWIGLIKILT